MSLKGKVILDQPLKPSLQQPQQQPQHQFQQQPQQQPEPASLRPGRQLEQDDFIELDDTPEPMLTDSLRPGRRHWLWWSGISLLLVLLLAHSALGLWQTWQDNRLLGVAWSLTILLLTLAVLGRLWREWWLLRTLDRVSRQQARAEQLLAEQGSGQARAFCEQLAARSGLEQTDAFQHWQQGLTDQEQDTEVLFLYSRQVLNVQDRQARARVLKWSGEAAVMVAASPLAAVDMLLVLWRNLKMIDDISQCYGIRLGGLSRLRLIRQVLHHMLYVGVSEAAVDAGMDFLGLELAGRLSARAGQGVGAGLLTARLGLQTMSLCRPVPWQGDEKKQLGGIRRALVDKVAKLMTRSEQ